MYHNIPRILGFIGFLFLFTIAGAQALSISSVHFSLDETGAGTVDMQYQMTGSEKFQYALITTLLDPATIGKQQLEKAINKNVVIHSITSESASFRVEGLAYQNGSEMITPGFSYMSADSLLDKNLRWVAHRFEVNLIPHLTTITFPDGYTESFVDSQIIPSIRHVITAPVITIPHTSIPG